MFPKTLNASGKEVTDGPIFITLDFLRRRENGEMITLPSQLPSPLPDKSDIASRQLLRDLSDRIREYYGPRTMHVLHLFTSLMKAIHFHRLLTFEHFVSITNVSGPPNIGKTFACAIMLKIMGASQMMLSRCTASAMIDAAHVFKNCLIVWDDPRDCSASQLSAIVHEAFQGQNTATVTRGIRKYNSTIVIGTQDHLLGMPHNAMNTATFSRLSHIDMSTGDTYAPSSDAESRLQSMMPAIECLCVSTGNPSYKSKTTPSTQTSHRSTVAA